MSAQVETSFSLFDSASHVLDQADLIELVSGATLRNSPPSRMVTSSPILTTPISGSQSLTRPSSPSLESAFNILGDQVSWNFIIFNFVLLVDSDYLILVYETSVSGRLWFRLSFVARKSRFGFALGRWQCQTLIYGTSVELRTSI